MKGLHAAREKEENVSDDGKTGAVERRRKTSRWKPEREVTNKWYKRQRKRHKGEVRVKRRCRNST